MLEISFSWEDGIIYEGERYIIPRSMRDGVLRQLHSSHRGVKRCHAKKGKGSSFWPQINAEIRDLVNNCETCRTFDPRQQKEPLISHDVINQGWSKVGIDLFFFEGNDYLIAVDY